MTTETADGFPIGSDVFENSWCVRCSFSAALFIFRNQYVILCPRCVAERIEARRATGVELSEDVLWLEKEAIKEVEHQEKEEWQALTVQFDDFVRCRRCRKLILVDDARYPPSGGSVCHAHCLECYQTVKGDLRGTGA